MTNWTNSDILYQECGKTSPKHQTEKLKFSSSLNDVYQFHRFINKSNMAIISWINHILQNFTSKKNPSQEKLVCGQNTFIQVLFWI